jgi:hypothetical protein
MALRYSSLLHQIYLSESAYSTNKLPDPNLRQKFWIRIQIQQKRLRFDQIHIRIRTRNIVCNTGCATSL